MTLSALNSDKPPTVSLTRRILIQNAYHNNYFVLFAYYAIQNWINSHHVVKVSNLNSAAWQCRNHVLYFDLVSTCSFTTLTVNVEDVNDNTPIFDMPSYEFGKATYLDDRFNSSLSIYYSYK